jgi:Zn-dependent protease with chaperone function
MSLAEDLLAYHGRRGVISFTIIDVAPVFVGFHARAVILVSAHALALVNAEEFAALVAHEIGHNYVWLDYEHAKQDHDQARIRELELRCDGIAVLTLQRLGLDPERLVSAVEKLSWYNQARGLDADRKDYVSREDRRVLIRAVAKLQWAVTDATRPTMPPGLRCAVNASRPRTFQSRLENS